MIKIIYAITHFNIEFSLGYNGHGHWSSCLRDSESYIPQTKFSEHCSSRKLEEHYELEEHLMSVFFTAQIQLCSLSGLGHVAENAVA